MKFFEKSKTKDFVKIISDKQTPKYISFDFYEAKEKIMKRVNLSHVSLLCIQGVGTKSVSPREIVWEGDYYQRYPATVFFLIFLHTISC